nr:hypothetical protein GCM10020092_044050 [Actinoplanes digitatis]
MPGTAFRAAFEACIDRTEPEFHYWHVTAPDGGDASLYGGLTDDQLGSILFNRFSTGAVLDLLATFLNLARRRRDPTRPPHHAGRRSTTRAPPRGTPHKRRRGTKRRGHGIRHRRGTPT